MSSIFLSYVDVGERESTLVDDLLAHGYEDITVLDISHKAIQESRKRIGRPAEHLRWRVADITKAELSQLGLRRVARPCSVSLSNSTK